MSKIICSPGSYVQGNGEIRKLAKYCQEFGVKKAYLVVDNLFMTLTKIRLKVALKLKRCHIQR